MSGQLFAAPILCQLHHQPPCHDPPEMSRLIKERPFSRSFSWLDKQMEHTFTASHLENCPPRISSSIPGQSVATQLSTATFHGSFARGVPESPPQYDRCVSPRAASGPSLGQLFSSWAPAYRPPVAARTGRVTQVWLNWPANCPSWRPQIGLARKLASTAKAATGPGSIR